MSLQRDIQSLTKVAINPADPVESAREMAQACNKLPDAKWDQLSDEAQAWSNEVITAFANTVEGKTPDGIMLPDEWLSSGRYKPKNGGNGGQPREATSETQARPVIREKTTVQVEPVTEARTPRQRTATPIESIPLSEKKSHSDAMKKAWETRRANAAAAAKAHARDRVPATAKTTKAKTTKAKTTKGKSAATHRSHESAAQLVLSKGLEELQFLVKVAKQPDCPASIKASIKTMVEAELREFIGDL